MSATAKNQTEEAKCWHIRWVFCHLHWGRNQGGRLKDFLLISTVGTEPCCVVAEGMTHCKEFLSIFVIQINQDVESCLRVLKNILGKFRKGKP